MPLGIETAGSVVSLVDVSVQIVREVRKARERALGMPATLYNVSRQLDNLENSLNLVRDERSLQSVVIEQQLQNIVQLATELKQFYDQLSQDQQKSPTSQFVHSLRSGDHEGKDLEGILKRLDTAKSPLSMRILVTHVGVVGNVQDGFRVAYGVLEETNSRVQHVLGVNMALLELLRNRDRGPDGTTPVVAAELESLKAPRPGGASQTVQNTIYGNKGIGYVMTGNVDVGSNYQAASRTNAITDNDFGENSRLMTGDIGGEAAASFNQSFWK